MRFASVLLLVVAVIFGGLAGCMDQVWRIHVSAFYVYEANSATYPVPSGTMMAIDCPDTGDGLFTSISKGNNFTFINLGPGITGDCAFRDIEINGSVYECDPVQFPNCEFFMDLVEGENEVYLGDVAFTSP